MIARAYLLLISILYFALAIWCSVSPDITSEKVGFELQGGSGQSEFLTVYGGLEFGLGLIFAFALCRKQTVTYGVVNCVLIHASLVVFRTIGFFTLPNIGSFTYQLAAGEWVAVIVGIAILVSGRTRE